MTGAGRTGRETPAGGLLALLAALVLVLGGVVAGLRLSPPAALPASAAGDQFSAERAGEVLRRLLPSSTPHPVGSVAQEQVRQRIVQELQDLALNPEVETSFVCAPARGAVGCATVSNIVATVPGQEGAGRAVLLVAHYDSVPAGPGVSDDGSGVAEQIEVARALLNGPPLRRPVTLLVTDAEEAGLLGARAYVERHDVAREAFAVVNLEARGTSGPSLMFETGPGNHAVIDLFARAAPRPVTASVLTTVYERMPHDTDFDVFTELGLPGLNFAVIGGLPRYHTPLDDLAHVDLTSVQHQGETALAVVRELAQHPEPELQRGSDAVFLDLLGLVVLRWPTAWTVPLAGLVLLLAVSTTVVLLRRRQATGRGCAAAGTVAALLMISGAVLSVVAHLVLRTVGAVPGPWVAHPLPALVVLAGAAALPVLPLASRARTAGWVGSWVAGWWLATLAGVVSAVLLPEASYLFLVPALAAWLVGLAVVTVGEETSAAGAAALLLLPLAVLTGIWAPLVILVWHGLGFTGLLFGLGPVWLPAWLFLLMLLLPLAAVLRPPRGWRRAGTVVLPVLVAVAVLAATLLPTFSPQVPQHVTLQAVRDPGGQSRWRAESLGPLPAPWRALANWDGLGKAESGLSIWQAPAPPVGLAAPAFERADPIPAGSPQEERRVTGRLLPAGGDELFLRLPADRVVGVRVDGRTVPPAEQDPRYVDCRIFAPADTGIQLELDIVGHEPVPLHLVGLHHELPAAGEPFHQARPPSAVPVDLGDATRLDTVIDL